MSYLYGIHDPGGEHLMADAPGWVLCTEAIGCDPYDRSGRDYRYLADAGFTVIARLNNGYQPAGAIPAPPYYSEFAQRCANFVAESKGCTHWIIGNETNLYSVEGPAGRPIDAIEYAQCYGLVRSAIHHAQRNARVIVAGVAPWCTEGGVDWLEYFQEVLDFLAPDLCDGIALHAYTHGTDPSLITSMETMRDEPYTDRLYHFRAYRDFLDRVPSDLRGLPVYITEADQIEPWADVNSGWVRNAYAEIDAWNHGTGNQRIQALVLYRWENHEPGDVWHICDKHGVQADFSAAVAMRYASPAEAAPGSPLPPYPGNGGDGSPGVPSPPPPELTWDPRLAARGVTLLQPAVATGQTVWRVIQGEFFDEQESQGRRNNFVDVLDEAGNRLLGVPIQHYWSTGESTKPSENKTDPWLPGGYALDFPFDAAWPSYGVRIADAGPLGVPTDDVWGLGYGDALNPNHHTSSYFVFQRTKGSAPEPPEPGPEPPAAVELVHPLLGARITQNFYENAERYEQWNLIGHDGTDFGGMPAGAPICCMAAGVVAYTGYDEGYGNYCRVFHPELAACTFYAHMETPAVVVAGQAVKAGEKLGGLGTTGNSTGVHLHLEVRLCNADGSYRPGTPMPKGRIDPRSWAIVHGLKL